MTDVAVAVYGPAAGTPGHPRERTIEAVGGKSAVDVLLPTLADVLAHPLPADAAWVWLVEAGTIPAPDALKRLQAAAAGYNDDRPALLASRIVNVDGDLHPDALPRHEVFEKERTLDAAGRGLVRLRYATAGSLLVSRDAFQRVPSVGSSWAAGTDHVAWSARLLRQGDLLGVLVPDSTAVRLASAYSAGTRKRRWASRARLIATDAWGPTEGLWEAFQLIAQAGAGARPRQS